MTGGQTQDDAEACALQWRVGGIVIIGTLLALGIAAGAATERTLNTPAATSLAAGQPAGPATCAGPALSESEARP